MGVSSTGSRWILVGLAVAALLALAAAAFGPGLDGAFIFDSVERVLRNPALEMTAVDGEQLLAAAYAGQADYPQRGLAYVSLALDYLLAGHQFDPGTFKRTNLTIHVVNGVLLLTLAGLVLARWRRLGVIGAGPTAAPLVGLAFLAVAAWLLHPIQVTSVLYVVQRMTSLAATWVLAGAIGYVLARARLERGAPGALPLMYGAVVLGTGIGFLCKQSALLLPAYVAVLEVFLFDRRALTPEGRRGLALFFVVILGLPVVAGIAFLAVAGGDLLDGYDSRTFTLGERLLTQARVLFFYLGLLMVPSGRRFGLYHDDIAASTGLIDPWTTLPALVAWCAIVALTLWGARRRAPWAFATAWFLVGHAMESTFLPLELVHEHRNYLPGAGVWIAFAAYAGFLWDRGGRMRALVAVASVVWLAALFAITHQRAGAWRSPAVLLETVAANHPRSYRAAVGYAFNSLSPGADFGVRFDAFKRAALLANDVVAPLVEMSKITVAVQRFLGWEESAPPSRTAGQSMPALAAMVLTRDPAHNARLQADLDAEIVRRLASSPLRTESVVALVAAVDCQVSGSLECRQLGGSIGRWHEAAISNPRAPRGYRAVLGLSRAKQHAFLGEHEEAVRAASRAGKLASDNLHYRMQEATLLALLGRRDALAELLDEIERRFPRRAEADPTYRELRAGLVKP